MFVEQRFRNTSSQPTLIEEVFRNWMELSNLSEEKLIIFMQESNFFDEINNFFTNNYWNKIRIFVKLIWKAAMRWKNWSDFEGLHPMDFREEKLIEDRDIIFEFTAKIQELQNEVNCMNDSRDFKNAESVRSGLSHVHRQPAKNPLFRDPGGMLSRSLGMPSRNDRPPSVWDTHGISGNVFCKSNGVFFSTFYAKLHSTDL